MRTNSHKKHTRIIIFKIKTDNQLLIGLPSRNTAMIKHLINAHMEEVTDMAKSFLNEIRYLQCNYEYNLLVDRFRTTSVKNLEIRHRHELAQMVNGEISDIKIKWLYAPNSIQLDELLDNYLSTLNIREYKADIFNLVNQFAENGMEKVIEEYNVIQDTDYRAMQIGLHWKNEETHAELMETFLANYSAPYHI